MTSKGLSAAVLILAAWTLVGCGGVTPVETPFNKGVYLYSVERYAEAEAEYRLAIHDDEDDLRARYNLGLTLEHLNRSAEAREQYELLLRQEPDHPRASATLAAMEWESGDPEQASRAEARLRQLIDADHRDLAAYVTLGARLIDAGRLEEARDVVRQGLEVAPTHVELNALLGDVEYRRQEYGKAEDAYDAALKRDEDDLHALLGRGRAAFARMHWDEARSWMKRALYVHPDLREAHRVLAEVAERQGNLEDAVWHWWRVRDLERLDPPEGGADPTRYEEQLRKLYERLLDRLRRES